MNALSPATRQELHRAPCRRCARVSNVVRRSTQVGVFNAFRTFGRFQGLRGRLSPFFFVKNILERQRRCFNGCHEVLRLAWRELRRAVRWKSAEAGDGLADDQILHLIRTPRRNTAPRRPRRRRATLEVDDDGRWRRRFHAPHETVSRIFDVQNAFASDA